MNPNNANFKKIYGYGLLVLWTSVAFLLILISFFMNWPHILNEMGPTLATLMLLTIFGLPIAALASFLIGGAIWKVFKNIIPNKSIRASLGGGVTGAGVISLFLFVEFQTDPLRALFTVAGLFLLGVWCGWAGERVANRH